MASKRGRPRMLDEEVIKRIIFNYAPEIVTSEGKIISKHNEIWATMSKEIRQIQPHALYTLVVNNRFNIKSTLLDERVGLKSEIGNKDLSKTNSLDGSIANSSKTTLRLSDEESGHREINIVFSKSEFDNLVETKQYARTEKKNSKSLFRQYRILRAGKWQDAIITKLWDICKLQCGYQFKRNKIFNNTLTICGKCNCGSTINGIAENIFDRDTIIIKCMITKGFGNCSKRYLRNPIRLEIGEQLCKENETAMIYRTKTAAKIMSPGDPEPPHLYKQQALRNAVHEYLDSKIFDKNPIISLAIAKRTILTNVIHNIGLDPFYTIYWLKYQLDTYRQYAFTEPACIAIDATGSIVKKIIYHNKTRSKPIFLYTCVANTSDVKYPVLQMLSESHTTTAIWMWLIQWIQSGAPIPREVICDASTALLSAVVQAFTNYNNIDDYADNIWEDRDLPYCYIRIDVAHFMKKYANFLKITRLRVKTFYLACIGQLILARNIEEAENILFSILTIAVNETEGNTSDGTPTCCEIHKLKLKRLLTSETLSDAENYAANDEFEDADLDISNNTNITNDNRWQKWANNISKRVHKNLNNNGDRENAHYLPQLEIKLLKDMKWFSLWSAVYRDKFGYGRVPASSAAVEAEFGIIKTQLLSNIKLPMRADLFILKHVEYLKGRLNLANSVMAEKNTEPQIEILNTSQSIDNEINTNIDIQSNTIITHDNLQIESTNLQIEECPACINNDLPSGAHKCYICKKYVHALDSCSKAIEEEDEGFGQKRICKSCQRMPPRITNKISSLNDVENWRGLIISKSKSRYLHKNFQKNEFILHDKLSKIPVLSNGNCLKLKAINIKGRKLTLANTCAFDSVFQLFLAAVYDSKPFANKCSLMAKENLFFQMVLNTSTKEISKNTYYNRAKILQDNFPVEIGSHNCSFINCEVTVAYLCQKLFLTTPSLEETSSCDEGCPPRKKYFPTLQIQHTFLIEEEFSKMIEEHFVLGNASKCYNRNCVGVETTAPPQAGIINIIF